ncbi:TRAP transporter small permease subunit [Neiella sp. HB171785]|uniref:TRAP transporter small permease protein n=1 Tax=Neiella litorisoli TaxID=2771431 RepID=A0A8J6QFJ7_9GAMM|nr:TRAP transporter small permease subunit [Neiella litorisoli]MBD1388824.1 TRAP transporter small permease subunit [Neiella litorisoli]
MDALRTVLDRSIEALAKKLAWASVILMLLMVAIVLLRYGFNIGWIALQDSTLFVHALIFMGGAGYTLQRDKHVRVDVFYRHFERKTQAWVNLLGALFLILPVIGFIAVSSEPFIMMSWQMQESSPEAGGMPGFFILKSYLWLLCGLMALQTIAEIIKAIQHIRRGGVEA